MQDKQTEEPSQRR